MNKTIAVSKGDGIGPEISEAVLKIFNSAKVPINYEFIDIGEKAYLDGYTSGIKEIDWDIISRNKVLLKAPITTPRGDGWKSLNVTLRKTLALYANVRPVSNWKDLFNKDKNIDLTVIRENEEDLYAGIEHRQTHEVMQCLKLVSRAGCERICRYAFEYAKVMNKQKITCMVKDNIMKLTDGLFLKVFEEVAKEYDIAKDSQIIDIGAAKLATKPELYDVIVAPNLYGDILSDIAAEVAGSVGIAPSSNIGQEYAMFEAIHGSAPDIAGQGIANPSALLLAAVHLLNHIDLSYYAELIQNAWMKTIKDGVMTGDLGGNYNTMEFTNHVINNLGHNPRSRISFSSEKINIPEVKNFKDVKQKRELVGVDIFIYEETTPENLSEKLLNSSKEHELNLGMITNRGVMVWPIRNSATNCTDHWRCRFKKDEMKPISMDVIIDLIETVSGEGLDIIKTENLYTFDGEPGFVLGQGQNF